MALASFAATLPPATVLARLPSLAVFAAIAAVVALGALAASAIVLRQPATGTAAAATAPAVQRIARNSAVPMAAQLVNRTVDLGFTLIVLRVLGPVGVGQYEYAVLVWSYTKTFTDFGLAVLTTRDVAVNHALAAEYFGLTALLRLLLWVAAIPLVAGFTLANLRWSDLSSTSALAIVLLVASIVPDSYSDAANSICNAFERMAGPALLTIVKNLLKVALGLLFLALGWGVLALALTALLTNVLTAGLFGLLVHRLGVRATWHLPRARVRHLLHEAWPLLLNNLLVGLFFRADVFVLQPARGDREVGIYTAPYKFLNLVGIIPSYFTLALFPHLARLAQTGGAALAASYALATKLLLIVALPITVVTLFLAPELMGILGGREFLPGSAIALRILIWFLPFSYVNGVTQYVLIAAGRQRQLTGAFGLTFGFNLVMNLIFTSRFGYPAAAAITVLSELVLLAPFLRAIRRDLGALPPAGAVLRPLAATAVMGLVGLLLWVGLPVSPLLRPWLAAGGASVAYLLALLATGSIGLTERRLALRLLGRAA